MMHQAKLFIERVKAIALLLIVLSAVGCSTRANYSTLSSEKISVVQDGPTKPLAPFLTAQFCADISSSYDRSYFDQAKQQVASWIEQLVRPAEAGVTVYIQWITDDTFASRSTAMVITVPPILSDPVHSTAVLVTPSPTPGNPFTAPTATAQAIHAKTALVAVQRRLDEKYTQNVQAQRDRIAQAIAQVKRETNAMRALNPPVDQTSSDIYGCFQSASDRFSKVTGKKVLIIASDLQRTGSQQVTPHHPLSGVKVVVIDSPCDEAQACLDNQAFWKGELQKANVAFQQFYDPAETQNLDNVLLH